MANYPVKWFTNGMQGAPQQRATAAGGLAAILKACLVTGFGLTAATSLSWDAPAGMVVVTFAARHKFLIDSVIQISGSAPSVYLGEYRVKKVTDTQLWFEVPMGYPGPVEAITFLVQVAPVGWVIDYESPDGKILIMSPKNLPAVGNVSMRVDNSEYGGWNAYGQYLARMQMVEDVKGLYDYTLIDDWGWPACYSGADGRWDLIGDPQLFYYLPAYGWGNRQPLMMWGYLNSVRPDDRYHCVSCGFPNKDNYDFAAFTDPFEDHYSQGTRIDLYHDSRRLARGYYQQGASLRWTFRGIFSGSGRGVAYPNGPDHTGHWELAPPMITEEITNSFRGRMPGLVYPYFTVSTWTRTNRRLDTPLGVKSVRCICAPSYYGWDSPLDMIGFDLTGPWRS